ncbi:MAG: hypothetical protein D3924_17395 [Candidatus Electrothrix sp. AR4]|nr:hypothetical protein [Candidatus Electrothrix sp. AR4]
MSSKNNNTNQFNRKTKIFSLLTGIMMTALVGTSAHAKIHEVNKNELHTPVPLWQILNDKKSNVIETVKPKSKSHRADGVFTASELEMKKNGSHAPVPLWQLLNEKA